MTSCFRSTDSTAPIGIFDSGVGGFSVLREIHALLPNEALFYVADSGFAPYGSRSTEYIVSRCEHIVQFFLAQNVKLIVIACNTATAVAVDLLRSWCPIPIVAMEPAIKPASFETKTGKVGVLATAQTVTSDKVGKLIAEHGDGVDIFLSPCSGFVELVEKGQLMGAEAEQLVGRYVTPLIEHGVDTLVLGCTHYPFLAPVIQQVAGHSVRLIDPAPAVARQVQRQLQSYDLLRSSHHQGYLRFWTSGDVIRSSCMIQQLLRPDDFCHQEIEVSVLPEICQMSE